ncbi:MAG: HPP family protein [Actinomycetes bacterium]
MAVEDEQHKGLQGRLSDRFGTAGGTAYGFAGCAVAITLCGLAAYLAKQPMLFPSLGPSALLFFEKPTAPESSPYNAIVGHLVGIVAGVAAIAVFGLLYAPSVLEAGVTLARVGAAALSLALVALALPPLRASHPPAGGHHPAGQPRAARPNPPAGLGPGRRPAAHRGGLAAEPPGWPAASTPTGLTATGAASDRCSRRR